MTITINPTRNEFTATAGQTVFTYTYKIFAATDLNVFQTPAGQDCDDTTDQITTFTVTGVGDEDGGTIILNTGATVGDLITIVSDIPDNRTTDYQFNGDFLPDTVNDDFDRTVSLVKQTNQRSSRSLQFEQCLQGVTDLSLPPPSAGLYLTWKSDLSGMENAGAPVIIITTTNTGVVADMKASATLTIGDILTTTGYSTAGDGGDNQYEIVAGGTGTDDSGTFIDLPTSGLQAKGLFPRGIFNVEQFDNVFASAAAGTSGRELVISSAISESSNVSIASIILNFKSGGVLTLTGGAILTFDNPGQIEADRRQKIFSISTFAQIVFTNRGTVHAGWWGFSTTETAVNNTTNLGFAINATVAMQGTCRMHLGTFLMNALTITVSVEEAAFALIGEFHSWLDSVTPASKGTILHYPNISGSDDALAIVHSGTFGGGLRLEWFHLQGPSDHRAVQATTTTGLRLTKFPRSYIQASVGFFNTGINSNNMFITTYHKCMGLRCAFGIILDTNSNKIVIRDFIGEANQVGIRMKEGSGVTIDSPELESCTQGIYVNPASGVDIRNLLIINPDFESNTGTIEIGVDTYNVKNGDIRDVRLIGGHYDDITNFPLIRNAVDVFIDVDERYVLNFDIDSTVSWSMPTTSAFSLATAGGASTKALTFSEFRTHINQTIGGTVTVTLPDINICPRLTDYTIIRTDTNAGLVVIDGFSAQVMNGVDTLGLEGVNSHVTLWRDVVDTEQWRIKSGGPSGVERAFNPPSLAAGASVSQAVTVTGARLENKAHASFSLDTQGITLSAEVTGSNATLVTFFNQTGAPIDLASGDIFVRVEK